MESSVEPVENRKIDVKVKTHFTGTVMKTGLAGAMISLGLEVPGYLHISQIPGESPNQPVKRVEDVLKPGQEIEVWVRKVKEGRIELTMLKPLDYDWRDLKKGIVVKGKVVKLEKFGAFVEIGAERPGLIHISEMAHGYVRTPADVVKEGDEVEAQVLDVDRHKKQIKLSLKAMTPEPEKAEPTELIENAQREKGTRRRKGKGAEGGRGSMDGSAGDAVAEEAKEPDPTAMELALRAAMEKAKSRKVETTEKVKKTKAVSKEQSDLLSRTLESKVHNP